MSWVVLVVMSSCVTTAATGGMFPFVRGQTKLIYGAQEQTKPVEIRRTSLHAAIPISRSDTNIGIKYSLNNLKTLPDALIIKHKTKTLGGPSHVNAYWNINAKRIDFLSRWKSRAGGLSVAVRGNSDDKVTHVLGSITRRVGRSWKVQMNSKYATLSNIYNIASTVSVGSTLLRAKYDSDSKHTTLSATQHIRPRETITPSINLSTGKLLYMWRKAYSGGLLAALFRPGESLGLRWVDSSATGNGVWATQAEIPLSDISKSRMSVSRSWYL